MLTLWWSVRRVGRATILDAIHSGSSFDACSCTQGIVWQAFGVTTRQGFAKLGYIMEQNLADTHG